MNLIESIDGQDTELSNKFKPKKNKKKFNEVTMILITKQKGHTTVSGNSATTGNTEPDI